MFRLVCGPSRPSSSTPARRAGQRERPECYAADALVAFAAAGAQRARRAGWDRRRGRRRARAGGRRVGSSGPPGGHGGGRGGSRRSGRAVMSERGDLCDQGGGASASSYGAGHAGRRLSGRVGDRRDRDPLGRPPGPSTHRGPVDCPVGPGSQLRGTGLRTADGLEAHHLAGGWSPPGQPALTSWPCCARTTMSGQLPRLDPGPGLPDNGTGTHPPAAYRPDPSTTTASTSHPLPPPRSIRRQMHTTTIEVASQDGRTVPM